MAKQTPTYSQFACIGSGFSAIGLGATLKRWYGITDVRFFEKHTDLGGTWFANKYPGCACDVPSILYSFSFAPNPKWSQVLATADELWAYLKKVADDYDLERKMSYQSEVIRCEWMEQTSRWRLHVRNLVNDSVSIHECQFLFSGTGILVQPKPIDIPGADTFKGPLFHSAQWRQDVDLTDKRVVLIGNGCTASQIVPAIVQKTKTLNQFVRSKHWIVPPINVPYTKFWQGVFEHVPGVLAVFRMSLFLFTENNMRGFFMTKSAEKFRERSEAEAARYIKKTAPAEYHDMLIPDFPIGCKRRIYDPGYCKALHASNLTVSQEPVVEILPEGVRTKDGKITEADVIVTANGFDTNQFFAGVDVIGKSGQTIHQHWESWDGPEAYNCAALSDFPNFFMLLGPNTATGHTSTIMAVENSINYALRVIKPVLDGEAKFAEVKRAAEERYSQKMQAALQKTVWFSGCHSWYNKETADGKIWNAMTYPHHQPWFWYESLFPVWKDWIHPPTPAAPILRFRRKAFAFMKYTFWLLSALGVSVAAREYWPVLSQMSGLMRLAVIQLRAKYNI